MRLPRWVPRTPLSDLASALRISLDLDLDREGELRHSLVVDPSKVSPRMDDAPMAEAMPLLLDDLPDPRMVRPVDGDGCPPRSLPHTTRLPTNDGASITHVEVAPVIPTVPPVFMTTKVPNVHGPVHGAMKSPYMPPTTGIFIGNVPLDAHDSTFDTRDTFVVAFNNSFRKTLSYVTTIIQNGEIIVQSFLDVVRAGCRRWECTAMGYFLGHKLYFRYLNAYIRSVWSTVKDITATSTGFYFFRFKSKAAMEEVIEGGPWLFQGLPIFFRNGNRDGDMIGVDVLDIGVPYIHCHLHLRCAHVTVLVTIGYGANDGVVRRELWQHLRLLARLITNNPWIVGGDFNTVLDMNKVCGASSDIHVAMHEFQDCINETGLIHLPMQGELFTWHNCSEGNRSLWKRLDHFLVNDDWLRQ
ncbi:UNVERIFIED_CONTAM: hypothetical protein Sradi_4536500 [Sesamum radiatum]|uniref:DUF4283 domain-containing protein n=1 Tax=Sesamum radiatum TaxID=300843 RepID=A0AAW2NBE1_SESRA